MSDPFSNDHPKKIEPASFPKLFSSINQVPQQHTDEIKAENKNLFSSNFNFDEKKVEKGILGINVFQKPSESNALFLDSKKITTWNCKACMDQISIETAKKNQCAKCLKNNITALTNEKNQITEKFIQSQAIIEQLKQKLKKSIPIEEYEKQKQLNFHLREEIDSISFNFEQKQRSIKEENSHLQEKLEQREQRIVALEKQVSVLNENQKNSKDIRGKPFFMLQEANIAEWESIHEWEQQFTGFLKKNIQQLPNKNSEISEVIKKTEKELVKSAKEQLTALTASVVQILSLNEKEKSTELTLLKSTKQEFVALLQSQKEQFQKNNLTLKGETMSEWIQPLITNIEKVEKELEKITALKKRASEFQIFKMDEQYLRGMQQIDESKNVQRETSMKSQNEPLKQNIEQLND